MISLKYIVMIMVVLLLPCCCSVDILCPQRLVTCKQMHLSASDANLRCRVELYSLAIVSACPHQWEMLGNDRKGCPLCASIADKVNGRWVIVLANGVHIGPEPCRTYPNCPDIKEGK